MVRPMGSTAVTVPVKESAVLSAQAMVTTSPTENAPTLLTFHTVEPRLSGTLLEATTPP